MSRHALGHQRLGFLPLSHMDAHNPPQPLGDTHPQLLSIQREPPGLGHMDKTRRPNDWGHPKTAEPDRGKDPQASQAPPSQGTPTTSPEKLAL